MKTGFFSKGKEGLLKAGNSFMRALAAAPAAAMMICANAQATEVINSINSLETLVLGIIEAAGVIITAWGVFEFANGYQSHDGTQQSTGLKRVIAGLLMVFAGSIMTLIGA